VQSRVSGYAASIYRNMQSSAMLIQNIVVQTKISIILTSTSVGTSDSKAFV